MRSSGPSVWPVYRQASGRAAAELTPNWRVLAVSWNSSPTYDLLNVAHLSTSDLGAPGNPGHPAQRSALLPPNHANRLLLADEVHARPPEPLSVPSRATYVAVRIEPEQREAERAHLDKLCSHYGVAAPDAGVIHWAGTLGPLRFKWERHGEFSSYTVFLSGALSEPFGESVVSHLPEGWMAAIPGHTVCASHAEVSKGPQTGQSASAEQLSACFGSHVVVGSAVSDGAGLVYTDFMIHPDGFGRILLLDLDMTYRQAGRVLQRLFEIEAYRMMALLALPTARALWSELLGIERTLSTLTDQIASNQGDDEALLHQLTTLAAQVERALVTTQSRFGASRAYHALVSTRISELREQRIKGLQTIDEFMRRRLDPAMATCSTTAQRLHALSERVAQASSLLSTRVNIAREQQNQQLLQATARRAKMQLRLQQTVEGLSLAAIVYYLVGLVGYVAKGGEAAGLPVSSSVLTGLAVPVLALIAVLVLRRARRRMAREAESD